MDGNNIVHEELKKYFILVDEEETKNGNTKLFIFVYKIKNIKKKPFKCVKNPYDIVKF